MIHAVIGQLVSLTEQSAVIRTTDFEFNLRITATCAQMLSALPAEKRERVRVLTLLEHREDAMTLYGFVDERERYCFLKLCEVNGIGAKAAMKILSGVSVDRLIQALDESDIKQLSAFPGIGAKTAQKMVLHLRGKLVFEKPEDKKSGSGGKTRFREVLNGLAEMGYEKRFCEEAIEKIETEHKEQLAKLSLHEQEEFIFSRALRYLG